MVENAENDRKSYLYIARKGLWISVGLVSEGMR